jgi:hypothetical protein
LRPVTPGTNWEANSALVVVFGVVDAAEGCWLVIAAVAVGEGVVPAVAWWLTARPTRKAAPNAANTQTIAVPTSRTT